MPTHALYTCTLYVLEGLRGHLSCCLLTSHLDRNLPTFGRYKALPWCLRLLHEGHISVVLKDAACRVSCLYMSDARWQVWQRDCACLLKTFTIGHCTEMGCSAILSCALTAIFEKALSGKLEPTAQVCSLLPSFETSCLLCIHYINLELSSLALVAGAFHGTSMLSIYTSYKQSRPWQGL